jgi:hypothetical protein
VPERHRALYEVSADGFQLNQVGHALAAYRRALAQAPDREPVAPMRTMSKADWQTLVGVAEPGPERMHFLQAAAKRRITVRG